MDNPLTITTDGNRFRFALKFTRRENAPQDVTRIQEALEAFLEPRQLTVRENYALTLAVEELVLNVAKYGAKPNDDSARLDCDGEIDSVPGNVSLAISDNGLPFDPTQAPPPPLDLDPLDRPVGGLGLHMLKQYFGQPAYRRENNRNHSVWTLPPEQDD